MLAVKKRREIENLSPKLMILPVRTLKRQMQRDSIHIRGEYGEEGERFFTHKKY